MGVQPLNNRNRLLGSWQNSMATKMDNAPIKTSERFTLALGTNGEKPSLWTVTGGVVRHKLLKLVSKNRMKLAWDSFKIRSKSLLKIITVKGEDITLTLEACRSCLDV